MAVDDDKYGLFAPFMNKFPFEENDYNVDPSEFWNPNEEVKPNTIELVKKFLQQVRNKIVYDIDCCPPTKLNSPFMIVQACDIDQIRFSEDHQWFYGCIVEAAEAAIRIINTETGCKNKLVKIEKVIYTPVRVNYYTLTAKEDDVDAPLQTFQVAINSCGEGPFLDEWKVKPYSAPATTSTSVTECQSSSLATNEHKKPKRTDIFSLEEPNRNNMFSRYMKTMPFEEKDYEFDESDFYHPYETRLPNTVEFIMRFLKQVRETGGYDIDCVPPMRLSSPFFPISVEEVRNRKDYEHAYSNIVKSVGCAIQKINYDTGHTYELVEIQKLVMASYQLHFLTFTAKDENGNVHTFQARVYAPFQQDHQVEEWRFKPFLAGA